MANELQLLSSIADQLEAAAGVSMATNPNRMGFLTRIANAAEALSEGAGGGQLIGRQTITASGNYVPTPGTTSIVVEGQGGGGSGGGAVASAGNCSIAGGGAAGGFFRKRLAADFDGAAIVIGAAGAAPAAGNNAGNAGGDTTFTTTGDPAVVLTGSGGAAGAAGTSANSANLQTAANGGLATNGDDNVRGGHSGVAIRQTGAIGASGRGGNSYFGTGAPPRFSFVTDTSSAGLAGTGKGSGGSGACVSGTGAAAAGGAGMAGVVVIYEFGAVAA